MLQPLLLIPNPVSVSLPVREAMQQPVLSAQQVEYQTLYRHVLASITCLYSGLANDWLCNVNAQNAFQAMLPVLACSKRDTKDLILLVTGTRSRRWAEFLQAQQIAFTPIDLCAALRELDTASFARLAAEQISKLPAARRVMMVQVEPEDGLQLPLAAMAEAMVEAAMSGMHNGSEDHSMAWYLDASHSFGAEFIDFERWPLEAVVSISDACLHAPAGLSLLLHKKTAAAGSSHELNTYNAPPSSLLHALQTALGEMIRGGGVNARRRRYLRFQETLARTFKRFGLNPLTAKHTAAAMACYELPELITHEQFAAELLRQGFFVEPLRESQPAEAAVTALAICVMGDLDDLPLARLQQAIEDILHPISLSIND